jgi:hypothetical protein
MDLLNRKIKPIKWATADHILAYDIRAGETVEIPRAAIRECRIVDVLPEQASNNFVESDISSASSPRSTEGILQGLAAMNNETKELINHAIQQTLKLDISFDSRAGIRQDIIVPRHWTGTGELCAYSEESHGEIYIHPSAIMRCIPYDGTSDEKNYPRTMQLVCISHRILINNLMN